MDKIKASYKLSTQETELLSNTFLDESHYDVLIDKDVDVYTTSGKPLLFFRKNYIDYQVIKEAALNCETAAQPTNTRGPASGGELKRRILKDGSLSRSTQTYIPGTETKLSVQSGIMGYFDRAAHFDYCRTTAFTKQKVEKWEKSLELIKKVDQGFKDLVPGRYERQYMMAEATHPNFRILDTAFTTVTVNKDFRTACHTDRGDYEKGFGNLVAYTRNIKGAIFVLPQFKIGVKLRTGDLLLVDVHQWHGNTEIIPAGVDPLRISFVMYYRENMIRCKSPSEELERIKLNKTAVLRKYAGII